MMVFKKHYKLNISFKSTIILIVLFIVLNTAFLFAITSKKISSTMLTISNKSIDNIITNLLNNKVSIADLKDINELIEVHYNKDQIITGVSYNLENAYKIMLTIKSSLIDDVEDLLHNQFVKEYNIVGNNLIIDIPFYAFTNNAIFSNLGPKIKARINLINNITGYVQTSIKSYGINTALVELYFSFNINSRIIIPFENKEITNNYKLLISSKVIQGQIPSIYNGLLENNSSLINIE